MYEWQTLPSPFPISPKDRVCLFTAPSYRELGKWGAAAVTFSSWHKGRPEALGLAPCKHPATGTPGTYLWPLQRGDWLAFILVGWLLLPAQMYWEQQNGFRKVHPAATTISSRPNENLSLLGQFSGSFFDAAAALHHHFLNLRSKVPQWTSALALTCCSSWTPSPTHFNLNNSNLVALAIVWVLQIKHSLKKGPGPMLFQSKSWRPLT